MIHLALTVASFLFLAYVAIGVLQFLYAYLSLTDEPRRPHTGSIWTKPWPWWAEALVIVTMLALPVVAPLIFN